MERTEQREKINIGNKEIENRKIQETKTINRIYKDCIQIMRTLFKECRLVHSDFSEYNLLYHNNEIWVIDVAQAVEHDHPNSFIFLKRDVHNINEFFEKNGVEILLDQQIFEFITKFDKKKDKTAKAKQTIFTGINNPHSNSTIEIIVLSDFENREGIANIQ